MVSRKIWFTVRRKHYSTVYIIFWHQETPLPVLPYMSVSVSADIINKPQLRVKGVTLQTFPNLKIFLI